MVEDLTLFQAHKQIVLKQVLKQKFGVHFPPISLRTRLCCLTLAGFSGSEFSGFLVLHCLIHVMSDMNLVHCLLTQRKVEQYLTFVARKQIAGSFLNFVAPNCAGSLILTPQEFKHGKQSALIVAQLIE